MISLPPILKSYSHWTKSEVFYNLPNISFNHIYDFFICKNLSLWYIIWGHKQAQ